VIVPIRNEEAFIASTIRYLTTQDYPADRLEIIVVDGESDDRSCDIVKELGAEDSRVKLLNNPRRLSSAGRNIGAEAATGEIITFIDGHTYINNNQLLKNTAELMASKKLSVLSRPQFLETPDNTYFQRAVALARKSTIGHGLDSTIYTAEDKFVDPSSSGASYRREVFDKIGYYDERFDACEDVEFNYRAARAGYDSFTSLKLVVYYYPRNSIAGLFRQLKRYGIGRFRLYRKHPESLSLGTLMPAFITAGLPILIIGAFFLPVFIYLLLIFGVIYVSAVLGWSLAVSLRQGLKYLPVLPLIYPTIHFGLGYGFLSEFFRAIFGKSIDFKNPI